MEGLPTSVKPSTFRLTSITLGQKMYYSPQNSSFAMLVARTHGACRRHEMGFRVHG